MGDTGGVRQDDASVRADDTGRAALATAVERGDLQIDGDRGAVLAACSALDQAGVR